MGFKWRLRRHMLRTVAAFGPRSIVRGTRPSHYASSNLLQNAARNAPIRLMIPGSAIR